MKPERKEDKMKKTMILAAACALSACAFGELMVKDGDTLAFLGDSITQYGQQNRDGYVNLTLRALEEEGVNVKAVKAGISGHKSNDMLKRLDAQVLSKKPRWMTLSCGVNDVWHQDRNKGVLLEDYQKNITAILDKCAASNCTVIVLTATMFERHGLEKDPHNVKLAPYNEWLRAEAKRRGLPLADLNALMWAEHAKDAKASLTRDGVHMALPGDKLMARGVLAAMGLASDRIAALEKTAWKPVWVLCRFDLKPDADRADYIAKTKAVLAAVRAEAGCREYRLLGDAETDWEKPQRFGGAALWMLENWDNVRALQKHLQEPHMKAFGPTVRPMRSGSTFHVLEDVAVE